MGILINLTKPLFATVTGCGVVRGIGTFKGFYTLPCMILAFQATVRRELLVLPAELLFDSKDGFASSQGILTLSQSAKYIYC